MRGYVAMLAVDKTFRNRNIGTHWMRLVIPPEHDLLYMPPDLVRTVFRANAGSTLVRRGIDAMVEDGADEVRLLFHTPSLAQSIRYLNGFNVSLSLTHITSSPIQFLCAVRVPHASDCPRG